MPDDNDDRRGAGSSDEKTEWWKPGVDWRTAVIFFALLAINFAIVDALFDDTKQRVTIPYRPTFTAEVRAGNVEKVNAKDRTIDGEFRRAVRYPPSDADAEPTTAFKTQVPEFANNAALDQLLAEEGVEITAKPLEEETPWPVSLLIAFGPTLLIIALWVYVIRRYAGGAGGGMFSMGKAKAKKYEATRERVTFDDVAGVDEAVGELSDVVDFLRNPDKYRKLGARIPRGVLLTGQPGTGKTLLARALAGEADVPFFSMSASEFVEMIVGVGASRVRDLFAQAKEAAPSIVFVDEIDAIGRSRGSSVAGQSGANDEREQTLNQILTEMDGFDESTGVIVLAATNRADVLDPALLRPGRFDRRVTIGAPDKAGRQRILEVHTRSIPLSADVSLDALAAATVGMVGADLANLANEAALLAARRGHERVSMEDFSDALERIMLGAARKVVLDEGDRRRTAYHEAGHALVGMLTPGADPVRKISIVPRDRTLGVTVSAPGTDRVSYEKRYLLARLKVAAGGRAAEETVFGEELSGAEGDIQQATELARNMVERWGMSDEVGFVAVNPRDGGSWATPALSQPSEQTRQRVDDEVRRLVEKAREEAVQILAHNRDRLDALAEALMREETLDEPAAYATAGLEPPAEGNQAHEQPVTA